MALPASSPCLLTIAAAAATLILTAGCFARGRSESTHASAPQPCGRPRIFSHRGLLRPGAPPLLTEASLRRGLSVGVRAFDLDLFYTKDGLMYVAHPSDVQHALRTTNSAWRLSSAALLSRLSALGLPPPLRVSRLLEVAAAVGANMTIALDLKGAERDGYRQQLGWLHAQLLRRGLHASAWLWVENAELARWLRRGAGGIGGGGGDGNGGGDDDGRRVRMGKPLRDVDAAAGAGGEPNCAALLDAGDGATFDFLGPSLRCANPQLLRSAQAAPFRASADGFVVWVVDEPHSLHRLAAAGVGNVISNWPTRMSRAVCDASAARH